MGALDLTGLFVRGMLMLMVYLLAGAIFFWSDQVKWITVILVSLWILLKR